MPLIISYLPVYVTALVICNGSCLSVDYHEMLAEVSPHQPCSTQVCGKAGYSQDTGSALLRAAAIVTDKCNRSILFPLFAIYPHRTEHTNTLSYTSREAEQRKKNSRRGICWAGYEGAGVNRNQREEKWREEGFYIIHTHSPGSPVHVSFRFCSESSSFSPRKRQALGCPDLDLTAS